MLIRWTKTEDSALRHVDEGTVAETEDELAKKLIAAGFAEPVEKKAERAVPPKGKTATRK